MVFNTIACQSIESKEKSRSYELINYLIETGACPHLDQPILLEDASWDKPGFSPMYSSILKKWFSNEDLTFIAEQKTRYKRVRLDSNLVRKKKLVSQAEIKNSKISFSHLSFPLFNKTHDVCLIKGGYKIYGLTGGSALYIFKKIDGVWTKVEMFDVYMS